MPQDKTTAADTDCPLCWGMGEVHREDISNNYRLFTWPCAYDCRSGGYPFVRTTVTPDRAKKMTTLMLKNIAQRETAHAV